MWSKRLLDWVEQHLENRQWLTEDHATIADIAMYSYLRVANEGGIDITPYSAVTNWLGDVESLDGFIPMYKSVE